MSNQELIELRESINEIDKKLIDLIKERMEISVKIGKYKSDNNLSILNNNREKEVIENLKNYNDNKLDNKFIERVWLQIMGYSKIIQNQCY
jgi:chorismate mutase|tara:strand:+ start:120 stop:392 length:273 start_codon:yes stop_codon:yes gene_type:complete